jgi:hypothetical protein
MSTIDLLSLGDSGREQSALQRVFLNQNKTAIILFTSSCETVFLHYCRETEIRGYLQCNDHGCVLCAAGCNKEERYLLPVYLPTAEIIGILPISPSRRPKSLLPQLLPITKGNSDSIVVLISRQNYGQFSVETRQLPPDIDRGESLIQEFLTQHKAGKIELVSVYPQIPDDELRCIPSIAKMLQLLGLED